MTNAIEYLPRNEIGRCNNCISISGTNFYCIPKPALPTFLSLTDSNHAQNGIGQGDHLTVARDAETYLDTESHILVEAIEPWAGHNRERFSRNLVTDMLLDQRLFN